MLELEKAGSREVGKTSGSVKTDEVEQTAGADDAFQRASDTGKNVV